MNSNQGHDSNHKPADLLLPILHRAPCTCMSTSLGQTTPFMYPHGQILVIWIISYQWDTERSNCLYQNHPTMCSVIDKKENKYILFYSILFYSILFYSILFYSILFYSILFYSILRKVKALGRGRASSLTSSGSRWWSLPSPSSPVKSAVSQLISCFLSGWTLTFWRCQAPPRTWIRTGSSASAKLTCHGMCVNPLQHTKRCRLSYLTNSALEYKPKCRGGGGGVGGFAGSQPIRHLTHTQEPK